MSFSPQARQAGVRHARLHAVVPLALAPAAVGALLLIAPSAAQAHHTMEFLALAPTPLTGLLSGLAHPLIGPDHLLFLLALSLVGLQQRTTWMLGLLATGLSGSALGLVLPGLPGAEALVALTLVVVALVLLSRLPRPVLVPAIGLHGYVLSASVLGWTSAPIATYLLGLMLSQGALLLLSLTLLRRLADGLGQRCSQLLAAVLLGIGAVWTWSALVP